LLAVNINTGAHISFERSSAQVANPCGHVCDVALLTQPPRDQSRKLRLIVDDQQAHGRILGRPDERPMRSPGSQRPLICV
jgi:hypothetical protein